MTGTPTDWDTVVMATAPARVGDVGGWTDTWFGAPGRVCNVAVGPGVTARAAWIRRSDRDTGPVHLVAPDIGADYHVAPSPNADWSAPAPRSHPLLEHAIAAVVEGVPPIEPSIGIELRLGAAVPAGASLGTSASVVVVLLAALDALVAGGRRTPTELAELAHQIETVRAGREAGVQDQWTAALGGCNLLEIGGFERHGPSPRVEHRAIALAAGTVAELEARWLTVVFGAHDSSAVHREVIEAALAGDGIGHGRVRAAMRTLTELAASAAQALATGDLDAWAGCLRAATETQERMHAALVGPAHRAAIDVARRAGAAGWKVNGAGGDGGSLTVLLGSPDEVAAYRRAVAELDPTWQILDLRVSPGVMVSTVDRSGRA